MKNYKTDVADFDALASGLTGIQRAILRELRDRYLRTGGPIADQALADLGGPTHLDVRAVLNTAFERQEGRWACPHIQSEVETAKAVIEAKQRAARSRWEAKPKARAERKSRASRGGRSDADAMHVQCRCNADAMQMHGITQPCGFAGDSVKSGGDYRGGILKNINTTTQRSTFKEPPHKVPQAQQSANAPAWLPVVAKWFGRQAGATDSAEAMQAEGVDRDCKPTDGDLATLGRYYAAAHPAGSDFRRRSLSALLRHWAGEMDRARMYAKALKAREAAL